jgi:hypothetical protein
VRFDPSRRLLVSAKWHQNTIRLMNYIEGVLKMASTKQKSAARRNIKKAAAAAKRKRTIAHLPKSVRTALGKQASSMAKKKRKRTS